MINLTENLKKYIKEAFEVGMTKNEVKKALSSGGFNKNDIEKAFFGIDELVEKIRKENKVERKKSGGLFGFLKR